MPKLWNIIKHTNSRRYSRGGRTILVERPWGWYRVLHTGADYQVKELYVKPYHQLSLQSHKKRSEVWTVVFGRGSCIIGVENKSLSVGDVVKIKKGQIHRLSAQNEPIKIIEVQVGDYDESDIERYMDDYGRIDSKQTELSHISRETVQKYSEWS